MSQYTTQLRYIVEVNSTPGKSVTERCAEAAPKIFPSDWKYFDEAKKLDFETAFLRHFYMQEICCETVGLWKIMLYDWLWTNMPYYNQKLKALTQDYDFLNTFDYTEMSQSGEEGNDNKSQNEKTNSDGENSEHRKDSGTGHSFVKEYDFPSNNISTITDHITSGTETDSSASNEGDTTNTRTDNTERNLIENSDYSKTTKNMLTRKGRSGNSPAALMRDYLEAIQNVYSEIFEKADVLFMGLW